MFFDTPLPLSNSHHAKKVMVEDSMRSDLAFSPRSCMRADIALGPRRRSSQSHRSMHPSHIAVSNNQDLYVPLHRFPDCNTSSSGMKKSVSINDGFWLQSVDSAEPCNERPYQQGSMQNYQHEFQQQCQATSNVRYPQNFMNFGHNDSRSLYLDVSTEAQEQQWVQPGNVPLQIIGQDFFHPIRIYQDQRLLGSSDTSERKPSSILSSKNDPLQASSRSSSAESDGNGSALHVAISCHKPSVAKIQQLIKEDPVACSRPQSICNLKKDWCPVTNKLVKRKIKEPYTYPLNLAISKRLDTKVIVMLVEAAPEVLLQLDGQRKEPSLSILLRNFPTNVELIDFFLHSAPRAALLSDRQLSTPLHVACGSGAPLTVVEHIYDLSNEALYSRNFHGETAWDICLRSPRCSEEVVNFVRDIIC